MAQRLMKYYDYAKQQGGTVLQMRLAMKTGIPSTAAATAPDDPEVLKKFHEALKEVCNNPGVPSF